MSVIVHKEYLECQCFSKEHLVVLEFDEDFGLAIYVQMYQWQNIFKRLMLAFKYVFGGMSHMGTCRWDSALIKYEDISKIRTLLQHIERYAPRMPSKDI